NIAGWNTEICSRELVNHRVVIAGSFPIVFIHFNDNTIREILSGADPLLFNYYSFYIETLKKYQKHFSKRDVYIERPTLDRLKLALWQVVTRLGI
ncbi:MAG TPA: hypothetical protein VG603_08580, partial [Chitinophagales bacterium]|nr:hypothetical protein [Chitinophagales bacterium]